MLTFAQWLEAPEYERNDRAYAQYLARVADSAPKMQLSAQQQAVVDFVRNGTGSAFVEAVAGAGKTTTLVKALAETNGSVAFAAYNRKIADEIKAKVAALNLGNRVRVGTFHSFGLTAWRRAHPQVKSGPEAAKEKYNRSITWMQANKIPEALHSLAVKLVSLAKQKALGLFGDIDDRSQWFSIVDHFDLSYDLEVDEDNGITVEAAIEAAIKLLRIHVKAAPEIIDFDDMIYMPVVSGVRMWENEWVFVDEAQDTNQARRAMARKMLKGNGRALFVGDRHQAIYGFTGADNDAIDQIIRDFRCSTLNLTITYRCPKSVVAEAQQIVNHIQAGDTAPEGVVRTLNMEDFTKTEIDTKNLRANDAILCRLTKPLVKTAYDLIKRGIACHVEGKDIGAGLLKLVNRWKVKNIATLRDKLVIWSEAECSKLVAKGKETQAESLRDRVDTIFVIMDSQPPATTVDQLRARIEAMFVDGDKEARKTLTLSTVHKAKGREWPRVFILGRNEYMPSPMARQEWQKAQELNLIYVAVTRAQEELVLLGGV